MAKLNGVQTIDMVDGEITKIAYDGADYAKVDGEAIGGDVVQVVKRSWGSIEKGEFYRALRTRDGSSGKRYTDIEYGTRANGYVDDFAVFRKISASATPTLEAVAEKVDAIDKRVSALEGADKPEEPLKAGDYIEIDTSEYDLDITAGKAYEVKDGDSGLYFVDDDGDERTAPINDGAYTKVDAPKTSAFENFQEGDKVRLISGGGDFPLRGFKNGETYEVVRNDYNHSKGRRIELNGRGAGFALPEQLEKVTEPAFKTEKRHAKVGERILITKASSVTGGKYGNGDVLTVCRHYRQSDGHVIVKEFDTPFVGGKEYEVIVEEDKPAQTNPAESLTHNGAEYTLVSRKAQPGDVVVIGEGGGSPFFDVGKTYLVSDKGSTSNPAACGNDGDYYILYNFGRTESNVLVYAPAQKLKNGDYAVVLGGEIESLAIGDVVEIIRDSPGRAFDYNTRRVSDGETELFNADQLRKATDAEVAAAQPKPKTGDIVVITANTNASRNAIGDIGKVGESYSRISAEVHVPGKTTGNGNNTRYTEMRLATPAEIVRYEAAVKAHEAPKFAEGDYARTLADGEDGDLGEGIVVKIDSTDCGTHGDPYSIYAETLDAEDGDYFRPQDLEKLEGKALVFAKAGRKVDEYKKGDVVMTHDSTNGHKDVIGVIDWNQLTDRPVVIARYTDGQEVGLYSHCTPIAFVESRVDAQ